MLEFGSVCDKRETTMVVSMSYATLCLLVALVSFDILTSGVLMGVKESHPKSKSIFLRLKLSTIMTSCPRSERYKDVGHPQKPSPPKTITFFFSSKPFTPFTPACKAHSKVAVERGEDVAVRRLRLVGENAKAAGIQSNAKIVQVVFIMMFMLCNDGIRELSALTMVKDENGEVRKHKSNGCDDPWTTTTTKIQCLTVSMLQ